MIHQVLSVAMLLMNVLRIHVKIMADALTVT